MAEKRSIFEEVGAEDKPRQAAATPGVIDRAGGGDDARRASRLWLMLLFALVAAMIVVGGLTRLTDSGLSITEWAPVAGAIPPMSDADWQAEFEAYKQIPEFQIQNHDMELAEFKIIYWWEWGHRQLGRVTGLVWALGFFGLLATRRIPTGWAPRFLLLGVLGGLQGAIGWWMVSSGLTGEMLDVASYRLAIHLGLAFVILGVISWFLFQLVRPGRELLQARRAREKRLWALGTGLMHWGFLQILLGALVAGIDAGRTFTDWPLMGGQFFPPDSATLTPFWRNFFEDPGLVQFVHRVSGYGLLIFGLVAWNRARKSPNSRTRRAFDWVAVMLFGQVVIGIVTVLYAAPLHAAITHQIIAILMWVLILRARHQAGYPIESSVREGL